MPPLIEMDGTQWDRLTVLRFSHIDKHGTAHWDCVCRCGKELTVNGKCLRRGTTRSCGCFKRDSHRIGKGFVADVRHVS